MATPNISMPRAINRFNACNDRCDMASGHCACGAFHTLEEWRKYNLLPPDELAIIDELSSTGLTQWQLRAWLHELGNIICPLGVLAEENEKGRSLSALADRLQQLHKEGKAALEGSRGA
jgi:hypothetical protein